MDNIQVRHRVESEVFPTRECALARGFATSNYNIALHDHSFYEINIVIEGFGIHNLMNERISARRGDVFVIPPGISHGYESSGESFNVFHIILKDGFFTRYGDDLRSLPGFSLLFEIEPYLRTKSRELFLTLEPSELHSVSRMLGLYTELFSDDGRAADARRNLCAVSVISELCSIMHGRASLPDTDQRREYFSISDSIEYIHSHLFERVTLDRLAAISNMSRSTFIRKFRAIFAKAPIDYVLDQRVLYAEQLIREGERKTAVAQQCGFYDVSHMEKMLLSRRGENSKKENG